MNKIYTLDLPREFSYFLETLGNLRIPFTPANQAILLDTIIYSVAQSSVHLTTLSEQIKDITNTVVFLDVITTLEIGDIDHLVDILRTVLLAMHNLSHTIMFTLSDTVTQVIGDRAIVHQPQ